MNLNVNKEMLTPNRILIIITVVFILGSLAFDSYALIFLAIILGFIAFTRIFNEYIKPN